MASTIVLQYMSSPQKANIFDRKPLLYKHNPRESLLNNLREKCRKRIQDSREVLIYLTILIVKNITSKRLWKYY